MSQTASVHISAQSLIYYCHLPRTKDATAKFTSLVDGKASCQLLVDGAKVPFDSLSTWRHGSALHDLAALQKWNCSQ